ncbi:MAG TPA: hypothetical protein VKX96_14395 [Chloroflexota bacterium]|nr:hypothetical protein [Chloroflexota bacterium]
MIHRCTESDAAEVEGDWPAEKAHVELLPYRRVVADVRFQQRTAGVDQVVADVALNAITSHGSCRDGGVGDRDLGRVGALGDLLDDVAIAIARSKVHAAVDIHWLRPQGQLDKADLFEDVTSIQPGKESQAADPVSNCRLVDDMATIFLTDCLEHRLAPLQLQPSEHRIEYERLVLKLADQTVGEYGGRVRLLTSQLGEDDEQMVGRSTSGEEEPIGSEVGPFELVLLVVNPGGLIAQALGKSKPEQQGQGLELAHG